MAEMTDASQVREFDAVVVGAGIAGLYQLHRLREMGLKVLAVDAASEVGGTWYWNRYPGARVDSQSYIYQYWFSDELLQEWDWSERFPAQPETERYLNYVADKFDLRRDMQFNARVKEAAFDEAANEWEIELEDGGRARARLLITALGPLSAPTMPNIPGVEDFAGQYCHSAAWDDAIDCRGKRVIAEIVLKKEVLERVMKVDTKTLAKASVLANTGAMMAGAAYNGPHSANGIASLFIATGQDEANVVESHAGLLSHELLDNGDFYMAVTLPSLICATYGGGTGLPTQRECLELMDCYGTGKAYKLLEIAAGLVVAGELSLVSAARTDKKSGTNEWVDAHEKLGRNR